MKRHLLLSFLLIIIGLLPAVAEETLTYNYTFSGTTFTASNQTKPLNGKEWILVTDPSDTYFATESAGLHIGSGSKAVQTVTLSSSAFKDYDVSEVKVNVRDADKSGLISVKVGDVSLLRNSSETVTGTNTATDYTFTGIGSGDLVIKVARSSSQKKAIYIKSIEITYSEKVTESAPEAPVFTPAGGSVLAGTTVSITSKGADQIFYSFDGENFTEGNQAVINESCTLYAKGSNAYGESEVSSAAYTVILGGKITFNNADYYIYSEDSKTLDWVSDDGKWTLPTTVVGDPDLPKVVSTTKGLRIYGGSDNVITVSAPKGYRFVNVDYAVGNTNYDIAIDGTKRTGQAYEFDSPAKSFEISSATTGYTELTYLNFELVEYPDDLKVGEPEFSVAWDGVDVEYDTEVTVTAPNAKYMTCSIEFDDESKEPVVKEIFGESYTFKVEYDCFVTVTAGVDESEVMTEGYAAYTIARPAAPVFTPEDGAKVVKGEKVTFSSPGHKYGYLLTVLSESGDYDLDDEPVEGPEGSFVVNETVILTATAVLPNGYKGESTEATFSAIYPPCATPTMIPDKTEFKVGESMKIVCETEGSTMIVLVNDEIITCESSEFTYTFGNEGTYEISAVASASHFSDSEEFTTTVTVIPNLPELYLRGTVTGANWDALPEFKLELESFDKTDNGEYVYSLSLPTTLEGEFKIATPDWSLNFGGVYDNDPIRTFYDSDADMTREGIRGGQNYLVNGRIFRPTVYLYYSPEDWKSSWVRVVRGEVPAVNADVETGSTVKSGSVVTVNVPGAQEIVVAEKSITGHDVAPMTFDGETAELPVSRLHRCYTVKGRIDGFETEAMDLVYDIAKAPAKPSYRLITSADQLKDGMNLVIGAGFKGNDDYTNYLMGEQKTSNFGYVTLSSNDGVITELPEGTQVITLVADNSSWGFQLSDGKYLKPRTSKNGLQTQASICSASILFDEDYSGDVTITFPSTFSSNVLNFNTTSTSMLFACYGGLNYASIRLYAEVKGEEGGIDNAPAMHVYLNRHTEAETGGDDNDTPIVEVGAIDGGTEANQLEATTNDDGSITYKSTVAGNYTGKFHYTVSDPETGEEAVIGGHPDEVVDFHGDGGTCTEDHSAETPYVYVNAKPEDATGTAPVTMVADSNVPFSFDENSAHGKTTKAVNPEFTVTMKPFEAVTAAAVGGAGTTAVSNVAVDAANGDAEYYGLNGVRLDARNLAPGVYVRRQGAQVTKVIVK